MNYRPEIDGLRSISVLAVLFYHAGATVFSGGFSGVDVFFVISGFLITGIIHSGMAEGRFSFLRFYERRARRILPALFLVMVVTAPLLIYVLAPFQLKDYAQSVIATLVYLSNVLFFLESGYFAVESSQKPLLHTWSLSIEEQFYLIFPLLFLVLFRLLQRFLLVTLGIVAVISFGLMILTEDRTGAFFLIQYRAWELLAGAMAAIWMVRSAPRANGLVAGVGLAAILVSIFWSSDAAAWPGPTALVPVLGTVLLLVYGRSGTWVGSLLALEPMRRVGLISYSLYLWHLPFLVLIEVWFVGHPPLAATLGALAASVLGSVLSYRYVETPFRDPARVSVAVLLVSLVVTGGALGAMAYVGMKTNGFFSLKMALIPDAYRERVIDRDAVIADRRRYWIALEPETTEPFQNDGRHRVLILGDSLSEDLFMAVRDPGVQIDGTEFRRARLDDACMAGLANALTGGDPGQGACSTEAAFLVGGSNALLQEADEVVLTAGWQPETIAQAQILAETLVDQGKQVSVVGIAAFNDMTSLSMILSRVSGPIEPFLFLNLREKFLKVNDDLAERVQGIEGARFLDKLGLFCSREDKSCDILVGNGKLPIFDASHLTMDGLNMFGTRLSDAGWFP